MSNISKPPIVNNYRNVATSKVKPSSETKSVGTIAGKGEVHLTPDQRSGNSQYLMDAFYAKAHNLMASYNRIFDSDTDSKSSSQYFKTHKAEVIHGAQKLVESINELIDEGIQADLKFGTHFAFLIESILHDFDEKLSTIGIEMANGFLILNRYKFLDSLIEAPASFEFLFHQNTGLIDRMTKIHLKLTHITSNEKKEGQIIDYRT